MVAFYNQEDQDIYTGGDHFIPQSYYRLGNFNTLAPVAPVPPKTTQQTTTSFGIPYTSAFTGADPYQGGGKFGNLDLSNTKTFNKNVFSTVGPVKGWNEQEVQGFYDPTSHTYKTWEGKNIDHAGWFTGKPKEGDIEGEFTEFPSIIGMGITGIQNYLANQKIRKEFNEYKKEQDLQAEIDAWNKEQAQNIGATTVTPQHHGEQGGGGYQDTPTHSAKDAMAEGIDVGAGGMMGPGGRHYADGGRIGLYQGGNPHGGGSQDEKVGGRTDAGSNRTTAYKAGVGTIDESGKLVGKSHQEVHGGDTKDNYETRKKLTISPVIDKRSTDLGFELPTGVFGFDALTPFGKLKATANLKNYIMGDDTEPTLDYQGNIGPIDLNATLSDDIQTINASLNKNNWSADINYDAITGEPSFNVGYYKQFNNGGLVGIL